MELSHIHLAVDKALTKYERPKMRLSKKSVRVLYIPIQSEP